MAKFHWHSRRFRIDIWWSDQIRLGPLLSAVRFSVHCAALHSIQVGNRNSIYSISSFAGLLHTNNVLCCRFCFTATGDTFTSCIYSKHYSYNTTVSSFNSLHIDTSTTKHAPNFIFSASIKNVFCFFFYFYCYCTNETETLQRWQLNNRHERRPAEIIQIIQVHTQIRTIALTYLSGNNLLFLLILFVCASYRNFTISCLIFLLDFLHAFLRKPFTLDFKSIFFIVYNDLVLADFIG